MISSRKRVEMSMNTKSSVESAENYLDLLDENLMRETFELAHQDYLDGHFVPNSLIVDYIKGELGKLDSMEWNIPHNSVESGKIYRE